MQRNLHHQGYSSVKGAAYMSHVEKRKHMGYSMKREAYM